MMQLVFLYLIGIFISLFIRVKRNLNTIEHEKNNAELSYLKSQINPHFLFNTFNTIYSLAIKESADDTANGMLKLSGMMRYVVTESSSDFVPLQKELNYIHDYIDLQRLRLDKGVKLTYSLLGDAEDKQIAPLLLIPFIENAFKHGVNPDENSEITIQINIIEHELHLLVMNNKVRVNHTQNEQLGFGIDNTKTRLKLLYPSAHQLEILDTNNQYTVNLQISLV
jgi:LytS/YehU family sensor histidine kinase